MPHYAVVWFTTNNKNTLKPTEFYVTHCELGSGGELSEKAACFKKLQVAYESAIRFNMSNSIQAAFAGIIELEKPLQEYLKIDQLLSEDQYSESQQNLYQEIHRQLISFTVESISQSQIYKIHPKKSALILAIKAPSSIKKEDSMNITAFIIDNKEKLQASSALCFSEVIQAPSYLGNQIMLSRTSEKQYTDQRLAAPLYLMNENGKIYQSTSIVHSTTFFQETSTENHYTIADATTEENFNKIFMEQSQKTEPAENTDSTCCVVI